MRQTKVRPQRSQFFEGKSALRIPRGIELWTTWATAASNVAVIGSALSAIVALAFVALGGGSFAAPRALAENYGLPVSSDTGDAYVRALGARDLVLGLLIAAFLVSRAPRGILAVTIALCALVGAADFTLIATTPGANRRALAIHGGGTAGLLAIWALLRAGL